MIEFRISFSWNFHFSLRSDLYDLQLIDTFWDTLVLMVVHSGLVEKNVRIYFIICHTTLQLFCNFTSKHQPWVAIFSISSQCQVVPIFYSSPNLNVTPHPEQSTESWRRNIIPAGSTRVQIQAKSSALLLFYVTNEMQIQFTVWACEFVMFGDLSHLRWLSPFCSIAPSNSTRAMRMKTLDSNVADHLGWPRYFDSGWRCINFFMSHCP